MSLSRRIISVIVAAVITAAFSSYAAARSDLYPLTPCGSTLSDLCPLKGFFDAKPFHYHFAIHPSCIKRARIETPHGIRWRPTFSCQQLGVPAAN